MNDYQRGALSCVFAVSIACVPVIGLAAAGADSAEKQSTAFDRTMLPIAEPKPPQYTELDVRDATPPPSVVSHS